MTARRSYFSLTSEPPQPGLSSRNPFNKPIDDGPTDFDILVVDAMKYWHVPGLSIAIVDGKNITCQGYGVTQLNDVESEDKKKEEIPVTPKSLFDIASMSKSFTAAAMAKLVEDEELKDVQWRTPVSKLLDDFVLETATATENVTVEDILSHRSGLPGHDESLRGIHCSTPDTPASIVRNLRNLPLSRPLRTDFQYNNSLYTVSAHVISTLSNTEFGAFLRSQLWTPLGMERTYLGPDNVPTEELPNLVQGYAWAEEKTEYRPVPHDPEPEGIGAGSIISSVEDIARWICSFIYRHGPLSDASYTSLRTPKILQEDPDVPFLSPYFYALGWSVEYYRGHTIIGHDGLWAGCASSMMFIPSKEWGYVMMTNSETSSAATTELARYLIDELLGVNKEDRFDWRAKMKKEVVDYLRPDTKENIYPELKHGKNKGADTPPDLSSFAGSYTHSGYHTIQLAWDYETKVLKADFSDRSYPFRIVISEHAYDYWYVAELINAYSDSKSTFKCKFEVNESGICERVGLRICEDLEDLIWFEGTSEA